MKKKDVKELRSLITNLRFEVASLKDRVFALEGKDQKFGPTPTPLPYTPIYPDPIIY